MEVVWPSEAELQQALESRMRIENPDPKVEAYWCWVRRALQRIPFGVPLPHYIPTGDLPQITQQFPFPDD